jgi:dimeric dUTPase (all-alpha-NTP-PPase superfamily)
MELNIVLFHYKVPQISVLVKIKQQWQELYMNINVFLYPPSAQPLITVFSGL